METINIEIKVTTIAMSIRVTTITIKIIMIVPIIMKEKIIKKANMVQVITTTIKTITKKITRVATIVKIITIEIKTPIMIGLIL